MYYVRMYNYDIIIFFLRWNIEILLMYEVYK